MWNKQVNLSREITLTNKTNHMAEILFTVTFHDFQVWPSGEMVAVQGAEVNVDGSKPNCAEWWW